jgi:hypothetical protein
VRTVQEAPGSFSEGAPVPEVLKSGVAGPQAADLDVTETLDNGIMARRVERIQGATEIYAERARQDREKGTREEHRRHDRDRHPDDWRLVRSDRERRALWVPFNWRVPLLPHEAGSSPPRSGGW